MDSTLGHILAEIEPASAEAADKARRRLDGRQPLGSLHDAAIRLAAARHVSTPPVDRKLVILCAAEHDAELAESSVEAVNAIAAGSAEVNVLARAAAARVAVIDCGMRDPSALAPAVLSVPIASDAGGAAMTSEQAITALETGIALVLSFAGEGLDVLAIGQVSTAGAATTAQRLATALADADADPLEALTAHGGYDLAVAAGLCLAAAALRLPIVLDAAGAPAAALAAARLAPAVGDYLLAAHPGVDDAGRAALAALALRPLVDLGMTAGDGATAAAALPLLDAAARLLREPAYQRRLRVIDGE